MKKVLSLVMILIFSLTACGGKGGGASDDSNLGKYIGEEYSSDGSSWYSIDDVLEGESYIELKDGGKGVFCLGGDATDIKWTLENGTLKMTRDSLESNGTLKDGMITLTDLWGNDTVTITFQKEGGSEAAATGDALLDWWNGDWYGWWKMSGCSGGYEDMEGEWWDVCGSIDIGANKTGTVKLWDEDYSKDDPMAEASVTLSTSGTGEHGTLTSESGYFTDVDLEHADWIIDPGLEDYEDLIRIDGWYESGDDEFYYEIYLRPWGTSWDDMEEDSWPALYSSWYVPLIEAGKSMPDAVGADMPANSGNAGTYEEIADYFGVEGKFVKEEYSDHMKRNQRYYKWISKDNENHFIYVNFAEKEPNVFTVSAFNTSGFSGNEAIEKYLDTVKAEAAEADKASVASEGTKDFSATVTQFAHDDVLVKITAKIPKSGWSYDEGKKCLVENDDPTAFGAGSIRFEVRAKVEDFDYYKKDFENYQDIADRKIGGITFHGRTYKYIGYDWIEYVAQIDDGRALSIGLRKLDCAPGTAPDVILSSMTIK